MRNVEQPLCFNKKEPLSDLCGLRFPSAGWPPLSRNNTVDLWLSRCCLVIAVAQPAPILGNTEPVCRGELGLVLKLADSSLATAVPIKASQGWRANREVPVPCSSF